MPEIGALPCPDRVPGDNQTSPSEKHKSHVKCLTPYKDNIKKRKKQLPNHKILCKLPILNRFFRSDFLLGNHFVEMLAKTDKFNTICLRVDEFGPIEQVPRADAWVGAFRTSQYIATYFF